MITSKLITSLEPGWNHYNAALAKSHKTIDISEGLHNRFRQVVGKDHPNLYSALLEL